MAQLTPRETMMVITRECRDLLDLLTDRKINLEVLSTPEAKSQIIREHFENDLSGYGIPVEEYIDGLSTGERVQVVNETLANPEYTSDDPNDELERQLLFKTEEYIRLQRRLTDFTVYLVEMGFIAPRIFQTVTTDRRSYENEVIEEMTAEYVENLDQE